MTDVDLTVIEKHESQLQRRITALVVSILLLAGTVAALAVAVVSSRDLSQENRCLSATNLRFIASVIATLSPSEEREAATVRLLATARRIDVAIRNGEDPCVLVLPPIGDP